MLAPLVERCLQRVRAVCRDNQGSPVPDAGNHGVECRLQACGAQVCRETLSLDGCRGTDVRCVRHISLEVEKTLRRAFYGAVLLLFHFSVVGVTCPVSVL